MITKMLAQFVTDLLAFPATSIVIGRDNFYKMDSTSDFIIVDALDEGTPQGRVYNYDGDTEIQNITIRMLAACTLDFYGDNASTNAAKFMVLQSSEQARQLQDSLGIATYHAGGLTNLRSTEGTQQSNRYQVQLNVYYSIEQDIDVLRIDTAEVEFLNDK
jgi:hypothetical protein